MSENRNSREIESFLLNRSEAAQFLGVSLSTLALLDIPKTQIRRRLLYRRDILEQWAKDRTKSEETEDTEEAVGDAKKKATA